MIIDYDHNPALTEDQKLRSLVESIRLAFNEQQTQIEELKKIAEEALLQGK